MRAAAVVLALALGADCFAPAPTARTSTALNAAGHAVIVRLRRRKSSSCCLAAVDAVRGVLLPRCRRRCTRMSAQCRETSADAVPLSLIHI